MNFQLIFCLNAYLFFVEFEKPLMHRSVNFGALDVTIPSDSTSENNSDIKTIQQIPVKMCHKKARHQQTSIIFLQYNYIKIIHIQIAYK
jgi:hypothetical protein